MELQTLDNDDFLPPVSRWTRWGGMLLVGTFGMTVVLTGLIRYSPTVKASAQAQPAGSIQLVSATTSGRVKRVIVQENQSVKQGDILAYLDQSDLRTQKLSLAEQVDQLQQEMAQTDQSISTLDQQIVTTLRLKTSRRLRKTLQNLSIESAVVELTKSSPDMAQKFAQERRTLLKQRWMVQKQLKAAQKKLEQLQSFLSDSAITTPLSGTIVELNLPNPGEMVASDRIVAQIVPTEVPLVFIAWVGATDISKVEVNQSVHLQIAAYPFPDYGMIKARVKKVSLSGVTPQVPDRQTSEAYYEVLIQPEHSYLVKGNRRYTIYSGMEGTANILVAQETLLSWIVRKSRLMTNF